MRLYELTSEWRRIAEIAFAEMEEGELPADLMQQLAATEGDIDAKLAACCRIVKEMDASKEAFNVEASRLKLKASRCDAHAESLKRYMKERMEACDFTKREVDSLFTVAIQNNPPSVKVNDSESVPTSWDLPQDRKLDLKGIKDAIKSGVPVPGCEIVQGTHLRIR